MTGACERIDRFDLRPWCKRGPARHDEHVVLRKHGGLEHDVSEPDPLEQRANGRAAEEIDVLLRPKLLEKWRLVGLHVVERRPLGITRSLEEEQAVSLEQAGAVTDRLQRIGEVLQDIHREHEIHRPGPHRLVFHGPRENWHAERPRRESGDRWAELEAARIEPGAAEHGHEATMTTSQLERPRGRPAVAEHRSQPVQTPFGQISTGPFTDIGMAELSHVTEPVVPAVKIRGIGVHATGDR